MGNVRAVPADRKRKKTVFKVNGNFFFRDRQNSETQKPKNSMKTSDKWSAVAMLVPFTFPPKSLQPFKKKLLLFSRASGHEDCRKKWIPSEPINVLGSQGITCAAPLLPTLYLTEKEKLELSLVTGFCGCTEYIMCYPLMTSALLIIFIPAGSSAFKHGLFSPRWAVFNLCSKHKAWNKTQDGLSAASGLTTEDSSESLWEKQQFSFFFFFFACCLLATMKL